MVDVTYIGAVTPKVMEHHPWQRRARASGLTQRTLSRLLGHAEITISRQLRGHWESGTPQHVIFAIKVWEILTPEQRVAIVEAMDESDGADEK